MGRSGRWEGKVKIGRVHEEGKVSLLGGKWLDTPFKSSYKTKLNLRIYRKEGRETAHLNGSEIVGTSTVKGEQVKDE